MDELRYIKERLESDPLVTVNHIEYINLFPNDLTGQNTCLRTHENKPCYFIAHIHVSPTDGLYTAKELQEFMESLFPDITPIDKRDFKEDSYFLEFGRLYFEETIGKETRTTELDADVLRRLPSGIVSVAGFEDGRRIDKTDVVVQANVYIYPCSGIAEDIIQNNKIPSLNATGIEIEVLNDYRTKS